MGKYRVSSGSRCNPTISDKPFTLTVYSGSWRPAMGIIAWIVLGAIVGIIAEKAHRRANRPAPGDRRGHPRRPARRLAREGPFPRPHPRHLLRPQHLGHRHRRRGRPAARRGRPNSDLRTAIGHLGPPSREASTPLLPSHWLRLRSKDRGDLAVHEPAMVPGVRTAPSPCLRPAPDLPEPASARIRCWRRQADHPARTHPPAAQDDTRIEEHTIGVSTLPRAAPRPTLLSAWQCPNRCQQPDTGDVGRGDRQPTRVRFAVRESELTPHQQPAATPHPKRDAAWPHHV